MPRLPSRPVGAHVPVAGGLAAQGLRYAAEIGAETVQVFVSNPRGWALSAGDPAQDAAMRDHVATTGLPVFVHAPYLINLGTPDAAMGGRAVASLAHSLRRAREIGARSVVVHAGSAVDSGRDQGLARMRERLGPLLDTLGEDGPELLVEPMAGQGQMLCSSVADLGPYFEAIDWHPKAGVCLDTCHAFAAGHDLAAAGGAASLLRGLADAMRGHGGAGRLRLIHANDSKDPCGSRRDRHENIGAGRIGSAPFAALLAHPQTSGVPFVLETPGPRSAHVGDVATLKRLRTGRAGARSPASSATAV